MRATAVDALQHGYRPVVPREAVGDRNPAAHEANLYDIDAKYGDVVSVDDVVAHLEQLAAAGSADDRPRPRRRLAGRPPARPRRPVGGVRARVGRPPLTPSLMLAAERHDDGWAVWEQSPRVDADGKPVNFLDVDVRAHLAFYRAGIAAITEEDADAGLLVSMHGAGIYRQRYGLDPALGLARAAEVQDEVDAFVAEQEAKFGGDPARPLGDYELLQLFDRLSLYFCMRDVRRRGGGAPGLPARAGRAVARAPDAVPVRRRRGRGSRSCGACCRRTAARTCSAPRPSENRPGLVAERLRRHAARATGRRARA